MIKLHNSTKKVEHKNHSLLKRAELNKPVCFGDTIFLPSSNLVPYDWPNSGSEASTWWGRTCSLAALQPCMDVACFVSFALMGRFQDGWGACFQLATRWGESEATWLQPDQMHVLSAIHWPEKLRNMNYAHWYDPCPGSPPHHRWCPQMGGGGKTTADNNKPPGPMTEPHRDVGSVVGLRSSKEIVASLGWLKDLPMLVNRLQFFIFFNSFSYFSCQLCQFLLAQLATAHRCWAQFVFMKWFIIWGRRPARLDRNQHCEVEIQHAEIHRDETSRASILQSTATSSRGTGSRSHLHLGRKRGICWFPISWGKAGRSENLQSENSSLFIVVEVFNKSARVGAMEKRDHPVR